MSETEEFSTTEEERRQSKLNGKTNSTDESNLYLEYPENILKAEATKEKQSEVKEEAKWSSIKKDEFKPVTTPTTTTITALTTTTGTAFTTLTDSIAPSCTAERNVRDRATRVEVLQEEAKCPGGKSSDGDAWGSLPVLVERLRTALEASLASYKENHQENHQQTMEIPETERTKAVESGSQGLRQDLRVLEDLLCFDIQTALTRLKDTLDRIDVTALLKNGAADPTNKLDLLRLVSSLLRRLQIDHQQTSPVLPAASNAVRRRKICNRHTVGVSREELALARKLLQKEEEEVKRSSGFTSMEEKGPNLENKRSEDIKDKNTKDAINQRQSLRDKEPRLTQETRRSLPEQKDFYDDISQPTTMTSSTTARDPKMANAMRQTIVNKFSARKSKIKRANTIDIPTYSKLQIRDSCCAFLKKPIHVGDKVTCSNSANLIVPLLQPRTENDRKFLALINRNNDASSPGSVLPATPAVFKTFAYQKNRNFVSDENWNNRFSNIKTSFDEKETPSNQRFNTVSKRIAVAESNAKSSSGFSHAPSSPFKKIEKLSSDTGSKAPLTYHWPMNSQSTGKTLKEKARMFDRSEQDARTIGAKLEEKGKSFPRPVWIDRKDQQRPSTINESGHLDYRSFCKQFAPFVGKTTSFDKKPIKRTEKDQRRQSYSDKNSTEVMYPAIAARVNGMARSGTSHGESHTGYSIDPGEKPRRLPQPSVHTNNFHHIIPSRVDGIVKVGTKEVDSDIGTDTSEKPHRLPHPLIYPNNSFHPIVPSHMDGGMKIGIKDLEPDIGTDMSEKPRRLPHPSIHTNNSFNPIIPSRVDGTVKIGTSDKEFEIRSSYESTEKSQWLPHSCQPSTISNDSFHPIIPMREDSIVKIATNDVESDISTDTSEKSHWLSQSCQPSTNAGSRAQTGMCDGVSEIRTSYDSTEKPSWLAHSCQASSINANNNDSTTWGKEDPCIMSPSLSKRDIQNQDIGSEIGVVTRYTSAIGTVAQSPELLIFDENHRSSSSPFVHSRASSLLTPEQEIQRHNMLQQSLIRQRDYAQHPSPPAIITDHHAIYKNRMFETEQIKTNDLQTSRKMDFSPLVSDPVYSTGSTNRVSALREAYEHSKSSSLSSRDANAKGKQVDSSDEYLVLCSSKPNRSIVLSKSESWHQLAASSTGHYKQLSSTSSPSSSSPLHPGASQAACPPKPPKPKSPSSMKLRSKQYEASNTDSVKKMEEKIKRYFKSPIDEKGESKVNGSSRVFRNSEKTLTIGLSRSKTMPGLYTDNASFLLSPNSAVVELDPLGTATDDVDKVFDDIFQEATRSSKNC
ncbi:uncharacterized protein [Prorops nasuta]